MERDRTLRSRSDPKIVFLTSSMSHPNSHFLTKISPQLSTQLSKACVLEAILQQLLNYYRRSGGVGNALIWKMDMGSSVVVLLI